MEFGRLEKIGKEKFRLPADHPMTTAVLAEAPKNPLRIFVGCPVWSDRKLVGRLYPKGTKEKDYLRLYSERYNAIELNATGYGMPEPQEIASWKSAVTANFAFCPKVPQAVSRTSPLGKNTEAVKEMWAGFEAFGDMLGCVFLQMAPNFAPRRLEDLKSFLGNWDSRIQLFVELRHEGWFDSDEGTALFDHMRTLGIGTVITDVTARRDVLHQCLTIPKAFIRFDGHDLHATDFTRLNDWAERIEQWKSQGLSELYFFVHTTQKHLNPELADYFLGQLAKRGISARTP